LQLPSQDRFSPTPHLQRPSPDVRRSRSSLAAQLLSVAGLSRAAVQRRHSRSWRREIFPGSGPDRRFLPVPSRRCAAIAPPTHGAAVLPAPCARMCAPSGSATHPETSPSIVRAPCSLQTGSESIVWRRVSRAALPKEPVAFSAGSGPILRYAIAACLSF